MPDNISSNVPAREKCRFIGRCFGILLLILILLDVIFHVCYSFGHGRRVYSALPESKVVGELIEISESWEKALHSPLIKGSLNLFDVDSVELAENKQISMVIRLVTGNKAVFAVTRPSEGERSPSLFIASYSGWRSDIFRLFLAIRWIPGLGHLESSPEGARYFRIGSEKHSTDYVVSLMIRKDILLTSISKRPDDVAVMRKRVSDGVSMSSILKEVAPWKDVGPAYPYRFWFVGDMDGTGKIARYFRIHYAAVRIDANWKAEVDVKSSTCCHRDKMDSLFGDSRIFGRCPQVDHLAPGSSDFLVLLPSGFIRPKIDSLFFKRESSGLLASEEHGDEDAVFYYTRTNHDRDVDAMRAQAVTIACPGIEVDTEAINKFLESCHLNLKFLNPVIVGVEKKGSHSYAQIDWFEKDPKTMGILEKIPKVKGTNCFAKIINSVGKFVEFPRGAIELPEGGEGFLLCSSWNDLVAQSRKPSGQDFPCRSWLVSRLQSGDSVAFVQGQYVAGSRRIDLLAKSLEKTLRIFSVIPDGLLPENFLEPVSQVADFLEKFKLHGHFALLVSLPEKERTDFEIQLAVE